MMSGTECEANVASIRAVPYYKELPDEVARGELIRQALAGQDVYAYAPVTFDHVEMWVRLPYPHLEARFVPMDWARPWRADMQSDEDDNAGSYDDESGGAAGETAAAAAILMAAAGPGEPKCSKQKTKPLTQRFRCNVVRRGKRLLGFFLVGLVLVLAACDLGPTPDAGDQPGSVPSPIGTSQPEPPHRDHLTVGYCADGTWSVPTALFTGANRFVADSIDQAVMLNQDGLTLFVTYVSAHPYLPQNTVTITIPALPAPLAPNITPTPTPNPNNVYSSSAAQSTVTAANAQAGQAYQAQLAQLNAKLAATKAQVKTQTDRLRHLPRPAGAEATQTSLWSCIELQAQRLQQAHGAKLLLIESDFEDTLPAYALAGVRLDGAPVVAIFMNCQSGADCAVKQNTWGTVFRRMHAVSWRFYDPGASTTLANPFLSQV